MEPDEGTTAEGTRVERAPARRGPDALTIATAVAALAVAGSAAAAASEPARGAVLLGLAVLPFLAALVVRIPPLVYAAVPIPIALFGFDGGDVFAALLAAMALLLLVPAVPTAWGVAVAAGSSALFIGVAIAESEVAWVGAAVLMALSWYGGASLGMLRRRFRDLRASEGTATEEVLRAERRHLAREVHDLVAHTLTGTMLSLMEVRLTLDSDREAALRALDEAESLARSSLSDLRGIVRLLSEEGDPQLQPPIELEEDLARLIDGYRRSGVSVELATHGEPVALSVGSAWAVFRIVQESMTNAVRHAPGTDINITLRWGTDGARVVVENGRNAEPVPAGPKRDSAGRGIVGMSERATLLGGRFEAGPTSSGWTVSSWIPASPGPAVDRS